MDELYPDVQAKLDRIFEETIEQTEQDDLLLTVEEYLFK